MKVMWRVLYRLNVVLSRRAAARAEVLETAGRRVAARWARDAAMVAEGRAEKFCQRIKGVW